MIGGLLGVVGQFRKMPVRIVLVRKLQVFPRGFLPALAVLGVVVVDAVVLEQRVLLLGEAEDYIDTVHPAPNAGSAGAFCHVKVVQATVFRHCQGIH